MSFWNWSQDPSHCWKVFIYCWGAYVVRNLGVLAKFSLCFLVTDVLVCSFKSSLPACITTALRLFHSEYDISGPPEGSFFWTDSVGQKSKFNVTGNYHSTLSLILLNAKSQQYFKRICWNVAQSSTWTQRFWCTFLP